MKKELLLTIAGTLLLICGATYTGYCGDFTDVNPSLIYGACIDDYIKKCEAKAGLLDSASLNIRKMALRATVKGAYLRSNRAELIEYLEARAAALNPRRIQYHLNQKFAEAVHPIEVYTVLLDDRHAPK